ncbi:MAG: T9SS type A sorting domain-containing protein [Bacteroidetes bacterium]|nr:T9SS type A sorting domain-containing protein [Bacteroidota bacterium]
MNRFLVFFFSFFGFSLFSQVGPHIWQDHTSLNSCVSVARLGDKIYASYHNGIVKVDKDEHSTETLSKINGLSDVGVRLLRTNPHNSKLLVIYDNCNIDVIDRDENIRNYSDFKLKTLNGKKTINDVTFYKQFAYLACGFGIVIFDSDKHEISDTYIIGAGGSHMEIFQVAVNDSVMYAATAQGLYKCNYKLKTPNNFSNWKLDTLQIPAGAYSGVVFLEGKFLAAYSPYKINDSIRGQDTLYVLKNNAWERFANPIEPNTTIKKLCMPVGEDFSMIDQFGARIMNVNTKQIRNYISSINGNVTPVADVTFIQGQYYSFWVAATELGLFQTDGYYPIYPQNKISKSGLNRPFVSNIDVFNGNAAVSPSYMQSTGSSMFTGEGINLLKKDSSEWTYMPTPDFSGGAFTDICHVLMDRKIKNRIWTSSWFNGGLARYDNGKLSAVYTASNSSLSEYMGYLRVSGLAMDKDGNLWVANSDVDNYLNVVKPNGTLQSYNFDAARFVRRIMVDKNNYVWVLHEREGGITVFKHNNLNNSEYKLLLTSEGNGNLQSNSVFSIAEDKDGKIWVGTDMGVSVFYSPSSIFSNANFDSQPIKIVQDGNVELLLGKEVVTAIAIDGANNKWCGTQTGGVYCFSPDGINQLYHFTKENSPLYSNTVFDLNYDEMTGDVYIGTDMGLQSYRTTFVAGSEQYDNVYAFPNPVKPNYNGTVLVRGLVDNSIVKITDVSGNLVWETKSQGGQIEWNVRTLSGARVTAGVYMVYASTTGGELRAVTKVLVIN